jgi:ribA/ribD-fused uncharacterized protein
MKKGVAGIVPPEIFAIYFSGFSAHAIEYGGNVYPTLEHAYHCLRFSDQSVIDEIRNARSPEAAWKLSQTYKDKRRRLTDGEKIELMTSLSKAKLQQHPDVRKVLIDSVGRLIVKRIVAGPPGDGFWDIGEDENGANQWGKIWMKLRDELNSADA